MLRFVLTASIFFSLTACASRIELPGSVIAPQPEAVAVEGMGPPVDWRRVDAATGQISDVAGLEQLVEDFPDSASVRMRLLSANFVTREAGGTRPIIDDLAWLGERRYLLPQQAVGQLRTAFSTNEDRMAVRRAYEWDRSPVSRNLLAADIPADFALPESVLWDEEEARMLVTGIVARSLLVHELGEWRTHALENTGSLSGIALDEPRSLIWIASGVFSTTPDPDSAFRGLIALDRVTLEERRRVPLGPGASISDIAVGPDGTVYGSDSIGGGIYFGTIADAQMRTFIAPGTFRSPQGIAVRPDNSSLYISDYRYGLAQVIIRSRHTYRMRAAEPMLLDGVDGLWLHGNELIAVQNGLNPHRITAFVLGEGIGVIASHRTLEFANPHWTEPLGGSITNGALYYIGNGQWDIYTDGGALREGASPRASQVRRLQLVETPPE